MSGKRKRLNLSDKIKILSLKEKENLSVRELAEKFDCGKTQIANILKNKSEIVQQFETNGNKEVKRKFPRTEGGIIDETVFAWICQLRAKNMPISGPMIQEKASLVAKTINNASNFSASNGWLQKFRNRHGILVYIYNIE